MLLRSITKHVKDQNWFAVALDFFIVVAGILIAFQITNWNEGRQDAKNRELIIDALITNLNDSIDVQFVFTTEIRTGLSNWEAAYAKGEKPDPYYFLISGSDTAPDSCPGIRPPERDRRHSACGPPAPRRTAVE